jgi:carbon storage regulator
MLVLARREGEAIVIDGGIVVTVLEIRGNQIRLGIEAPKGVPVWRKELVVASATKRELAVA